MPNSSANPPTDHPLTEAELAFLVGLERHGVRVMLVGLSAAVLQGADVVTQDLDLWFEQLASPGIAAAAREAGGFFAARLQPPMVGGEGLNRIDIVTQCDGLEPFAVEYAKARDWVIGPVRLRVLPIDRVLVSKQAANRAKDRAVIEPLRAAIAANAALKR